MKINGGKPQMVKGSRWRIERANSCPISLAIHQLQFQWHDQDTLIVVKFGLGLVRRMSAPTHTHTPKSARKTCKKGENEHTGSHLLQSKGSLDIRGAAYPLPPCVKPFTRLCRESWGTRATAGLQSASACACLYSVARNLQVVRVMGKARHIIFIYQSP